MPTTLGLIGSGMIGGTLARLAVTAGLDVVLANSRAPHTLAGLVTELGGYARAATPAEAAEASDLVVAAIPLKAYDQLPSAALVGKTVIDTTNYYPERDGRIGALDSDELTSSELVQRHLPGAHVVKAFNNLGSHQLFTLARPSGTPDRTALPIAGDDANAKQQATELLDVLGYDAVDIGTLADSWRSGPNTALYGFPYLGQPPAGLDAEELHHWAAQSPGVPVSARRVKELAEAAVRGPAGAFYS
ncbi:NAD(P)-binding domain-containing protein [Streptomyces sp. NPDC004546]|uniref:NADPH-dependent F420 reductase n=1 Tax=unclassified Streptomyces TaxID=2593676 RepID=UPI0033BEAEF0